MVLRAGEAEPASLLDALAFGTLHVEGQLMDASNVALLARLEHPQLQAHVLYKPVRGERPLRDFPDGTLAAREAAAYVVSALGGWHVVPPTVLRDGPLGPGSVQLWVDVVEGEDALDRGRLIDVVAPGELRPGWLPVFEAETPAGSPVVVAHADRPDLASTAVFDAVVNNADRKGSHLHLDEEGSLWGFDHGVTFHAEPKLRTVLWGWVGKPLPAQDVERLERLDEGLADPRAPLCRCLDALLSPDELEALRGRVARLLATGCYPEPARHWPAIPWPPL